MGGVLIFDGDDTLWVTEPLYDQARLRAAELVQAAGFDAVAWDRLERSIDVANVERYGMSATRFPTSCMQALDALASARGADVPLALRAAVGDAAAKVFRGVAPLVDGADQTLARLQESFRLALLTKGDEAVQRKRIAESGLAHHFEVVRIVPTKEAASFDAVRAKMGDRGAAWSIGNSLSSDVLPAVETGMQAIWVDAHVWEYERRAGPVPDGVWIADRLTAVPAILERAALTAGAG